MYSEARLQDELKKHSSEAPDEKGIISGMKASVAALRVLNGLEVAGRTMITFMRGHMSEVAQMMNVVQYFHDFYDDVAKEFVQLDDEDFIIHHCVRTLFWHWQEEMDQLRAGPFGAALNAIEAPLPEIGTPTRSGRSPIASYWYDESVQMLREGRLPLKHEPLNLIMDAQDCVLHSRPDLIWPQFLVWCGETWARQIVVVWELVRETIEMRRHIEERLDERSLQRLIQRDEPTYHSLALQLTNLYGEWHALHSGTVDVHDPMYDKNLSPLTEWLTSFTPDIGSWFIKEPMKDEMYLEVACTIAGLQGVSFDVQIPEFQYWRRTPWTPESIKVGAPGMPPIRLSGLP